MMKRIDGSIDTRHTVLSDGVWATVVTPFSGTSKKIDWSVSENLIEWYIANNVTGIFACCLSSEPYQMTPQEKLRTAAFYMEKTARRVPVILGALGYRDTDEQAVYAAEMAAFRPDAVILSTSEFAEASESDSVWVRNIEAFLDKTDYAAFGLYECPYPYKRVVSKEALHAAARTGRFVFFKDTSCDLKSIQDKIDACRGTRMKFYNAHTPTLLESLFYGGNGYCGIGTNFCPDIYAWLCAHLETILNDRVYFESFLLEINPLIEIKYPVSGKYFLKTVANLGFETECRVRDNELTREEKERILSLNRLFSGFRNRLGGAVSRGHAVVQTVRS